MAPSRNWRVRLTGQCREFRERRLGMFLASTCCSIAGSLARCRRLALLIADGFGTTGNLRGALAGQADALFGSGWVWLLLDKGALKIVSLHDGDTPVAHDGMTPQFTIDVWEHACYIDCRSARPDYGALMPWRQGCP